VLLLVGCLDFDEEDPLTYQPTYPSTKTPVTYTIAEFEKSLSESYNGYDAYSSPVAVKVVMNLDVYWASILATIAEKGKYVALDLSDCTMNGTEFDLVYAAGKDKIRSLILPNAARSIWILVSHYSVLEKLEGKNIDSIGEQAFAGCYNLRTVSFPQVTSIGEQAFASCSYLETVSFPQATSIGEQAFDGCYNLTTVSFPKVESISDYVFNSCNLRTVSFPQVTSIGEQAFANCSYLTTVSFPKVESIGKSAFDGCNNLTTVSFPQATSIGEKAFNSCNNLRTVSFPKVENIGKSAFDGCYNLRTVSFPEATTIGEKAFYQCSALATANFSKLISISEQAFANTGSTSLEIKLGTAAPPTVGTGIFYYDGYYGSDYNTNGKSVTVTVPYADATAWEAAGYNATWQASFKSGSSIDLKEIGTY
jgi:predicted RNA-binding protein with PUA-like domain